MRAQYSSLRETHKHQMGLRREDRRRRWPPRTCYSHSAQSSHSRRRPRWCPSCSWWASRPRRTSPRQTQPPGRHGQGCRGCTPGHGTRRGCRTGRTRDLHRWQHCRGPRKKPVMRMHEILVRIRIRGSLPLTNGFGFGSCSFHQWTSRHQQKVFCLLHFEGTFTSFFFKD